MNSWLPTRPLTLIVLAAAIATRPCAGAEPAPHSTVIFDMDTVRYRPTEAVNKDKQKVPVGTVELVDGQAGKAVQFTFADGLGSGFMTASVKATPAWNAAEGFSFYVKGDGSTNWAGLELIDRDDFIQAEAAEPVMVPRIAGDWWTIAGNPDLGVYTSPKQQPVDFGIWQATDGTWQLWSCIRGTKCGGKTRLFHRWEGRVLEATNWIPKGIALEAGSEFGETPGGLQAPFVIRDSRQFVMFYGDWEHICLATSEDGKRFTRRLNADGKTGLFAESPGANTRDPMVLFTRGLWHCYYTAYPQQQGAVYCRTSADTRAWSKSHTVAFGGAAGTNAYAAECPFVVELTPGEYYLFRTQRYGMQAISRVYHSRDPLNFGVHDDSHLVGSLPVAAPEVFRHQGQWYIASLLPSLAGIRLARLEWAKASKD